MDDEDEGGNGNEALDHEVCDVDRAHLGDAGLGALEPQLGSVDHVVYQVVGPRVDHMAPLQAAVILQGNPAGQTSSRRR